MVATSVFLRRFEEPNCSLKIAQRSLKICFYNSVENGVSRDNINWRSFEIAKWFLNPNLKKKTDRNHKQIICFNSYSKQSMFPLFFVVCVGRNFWRVRPFLGNEKLLKTSSLNCLGYYVPAGTISSSYTVPS